MKPGEAICRKCKQFGDHPIENGHYICPNCGFSTRISSYDEVTQELKEMEEFWLMIKEKYPSEFDSTRFSAIKGLQETVETAKKFKGMN